MFIHVYLLLLPFTIAQNYDNVGSVIFTKSHLKKRNWTKDEISLLQSRKHFQDVIPATKPEAIDEDYLKNLFDYIREAYSSIKREPSDPAMDKILTTALSDVIGGYLKTWVLPATKLAYYGGTVNYESAAKLYDFYKDLKRYLRTDGSGWRDPQPRISRALYIASPPKIAGDVIDPCELLAFYDKVSGIPLPQVKWKKDTSTMFLPLKNDSMFFLNSLDSAYMLFRYYAIVTKCLKSNPAELKKFKDKFQCWLRKDVVPHLNENTFYPGLYSILSLADQSKTLCLDDCNTSSFSFGESARKWWFVILLVMLEVVWCLGAFCYMIMIKKRNSKKQDLEKNLLLACHSSSESLFSQGIIKIGSSSSVCRMDNNSKCGRCNKVRKSETRSSSESKKVGMIQSFNSIGIGTYDPHRSIQCSADLIPLNVDEKTSIGQSFPRSYNKFTVETVHLEHCPYQAIDRRRKTKRNSNASLKNKAKGIDKRSYTSVNDKSNQKISSHNMHTSLYEVNSSSSKMIKVTHEQACSTEKIAMNDRGSKNPQLHDKYKRKNETRGNESENKSRRKPKYSIEVIEQRENKNAKERPYFEIEMEAPGAEIRLGIEGAIEKKKINNSKIPKRACDIKTIGQINPIKRESELNEAKSKFRSHIPKLKKIIDDSALAKYSKANQGKLNVTM